MNKITFADMLNEMSTFYKGYVRPDKPMLNGWCDALKSGDYSDADVINAVTSIRDNDQITEFPSLNQFRREVETAKRIRIGPVRRSELVKQPEPSKGLQSQSSACFRAVMTGLSFGKDAGVKAMEAVADDYPENKDGILRCAYEIKQWGD